jgi:mRNA-degrading endonuclease RelE of RelBE toxin-antitoxin system
VKIEWSPAARASARRYLGDQKAMHAIGEAIAELAEDPHPAQAFHRGDYHRMRVGSCRVIYVVDQGVITVERVDRSNG